MRTGRPASVFLLYFVGEHRHEGANFSFRSFRSCRRRCRAKSSLFALLLPLGTDCLLPRKRIMANLPVLLLRGYTKDLLVSGDAARARFVQGHVSSRSTRSCSSTSQNLRCSYCQLLPHTAK